MGVVLDSSIVTEDLSWEQAERMVMMVPSLGVGSEGLREEERQWKRVRTSGGQSERARLEMRAFQVAMSHKGISERI